MSDTATIFTGKLANIAQSVDRQLDELLTPQGSNAEIRLIQAMRHAVLSGGKRLRPFLLIETARHYGVEQNHALRAAAALECLHCYSLVHDDLPAMDDDDLRRGKPTAHIAFDEATAILAGDALLTIAFEILGDPATHPDPAVRIRLVSELAQAGGHTGMVGGQAMDLAAEIAPVTEAESIIAIQSRKTGALIRYACRAGAILGGAGVDEINALNRYADHLGLAFQIADDILDVESSAEAMGKRTGKDDAAGKATFVSLDGLAGAKARLRGEVDAAIAALVKLPGKTETLIEAATFVMTRRS